MWCYGLEVEGTKSISCQNKVRKLISFHDSSWKERLLPVVVFSLYLGAGSNDFSAKTRQELAVVKFTHSSQAINNIQLRGSCIRVPAVLEEGPLEFHNHT